MINGRDSSLNIRDFYKKEKDLLKLKSVLKDFGFSREITKSPLKKGMLSVLILGKRDIKEIKPLSFKAQREAIRKKIKNNVSCIILSDNIPSFHTLEEEAREKGLSLFCSKLPEKNCQEGVKNALSLFRLNQIIISGGVLKVCGLGILIIGDSGIGKSESALELIERGHRFISDDVTQIEITEKGKLVGSAPALSRNFMEIRGLGIINIKEIFTSKSVSRKAEINLVINLKGWERNKEYDRLGLKFPEDYKILGKKIPQINIYVAPGRNVATLIEIACKVHLLRKKGYHAGEEITRRLDNAISVNKSGE